MNRGRIMVGIAAVAALWIAWQRDRSSPRSPMITVSSATALSPAPLVVAQMDRAPFHAVETARCDPPPADPNEVLHRELRSLIEADTGAQDEILHELTARLTDDNVAAVIASLTPAEYNTAFATAALARWLAVDPVAAARWMAEKGDRPRVGLVARQFAADPATTANTLSALPEGEWKQEVMHATALELGGQHPAEAIGVASQITDPDHRADALETIAYAWCSRDPIAASTWLLQASDPDERPRLCTIAVKAIAATDPDLAAKWFAELTPDARSTETSLCLAEIWAARAPSSAAAWAASLAGPARTAALDRIVDRWMTADRVAATSWLRSQPDGNALLGTWIRRAIESETPHE